MVLAKRVCDEATPCRNPLALQRMLSIGPSISCKGRAFKPLERYYPASCRGNIESTRSTLAYFYTFVIATMIYIDIDDDN